MSRVQNRFGIEMPLRALFEHPTVEELALAITKKKAEADFDPAALTGMLADLESISEEEAERLLPDKDA